jgi:hypothetical protein
MLNAQTELSAVRQTVDENLPLPAVVDELTEVQTLIAVLESREANLKAKLIATGLKEVCGSRTRAVISTTKPGVTVSWKQLAESFKPSESELAAFSTPKDAVTSVRLYGFN